MNGQDGEGLAPQIEITLSKDRLNTDDVSYQRPSVPIRDVRFYKSSKLGSEKDSYKRFEYQKSVPKGLFDLSDENEDP
jgi:hypothetical protein